MLTLIDSAEDTGGAILAGQSSTVTSCGSLLDNSAMVDGGGIASFGKASLLLCNGSKLLRNRARGSGGGVYAAGSEAIFGEPCPLAHQLALMNFFQGR